MGADAKWVVQVLKEYKRLAVGIRVPQPLDLHLTSLLISFGIFFFDRSAQRKTRI